MTPAAKPQPAEDANADAAPVIGEFLTLDAIAPSKAQQAADRTNRKARTALQAFPAAALVALIVYLALLAGADLNVDPKLTDPPTEQVLGAGALVTWAIAAWMNRAPKDDDNEVDDTVR